MHLCDNCNFVGNNYRQYLGHLGKCNKKKEFYINTYNSNTNDEKYNSFNDNMEYDIEYGIVNEYNISENGINVENLSNTEYELSNTEDDHLNKYLKFQQDLVNNSIIDRLQTGRVKLGVDGSYSQEASINNYDEELKKMLHDHDIEARGKQKICLTISKRYFEQKNFQYFIRTIKDCNEKGPIYIYKYRTFYNIHIYKYK